MSATPLVKEENPGSSPGPTPPVPRLSLTPFLAALDTVKAMAGDVRQRLRREQAPRDPVTVAFVTVAWASLQVCIVEFLEGGQFKVLAHDRDDGAGGRDLDDAIFRRMATEFARLTHLNLPSQPEAHARIKAECPKIREMLIEKDEAEVTLEGIMIGADLTVKIKSDEVRQGMDVTMHRLTGLCQSALSDSERTHYQINAVELIGDCTVLPFVRRKVEGIFDRGVSRNFRIEEEGIHQQAMTTAGAEGTTANAPVTPMMPETQPFSIPAIPTTPMTTFSQLSSFSSLAAPQTNTAPSEAPTFQFDGPSGSGFQPSEAKASTSDCAQPQAHGLIPRLSANTCFFENLGVCVTVSPAPNGAPQEEAQPSLFHAVNGSFVHQGTALSQVYGAKIDPDVKKPIGEFSFSENCDVYKNLKKKRPGTVNWLSLVPASFMTKFEPEREKLERQYQEMQRQSEELQKEIERHFQQYKDANQAPEEEEPKEDAPEVDDLMEVNNYTRLNETGRTFFSVLYSGFEKTTNKEVFIKRAMDHEGNQEKMKQEIEIAKEVQSSGVVRVIDDFEDENLYYMVMDKMEADFAKVLYDTESFSEEDRKAYMKMALTGLKALHDKDYVHADIKPENLLYTHGEGLKLADFGNTMKVGGPRSDRVNYTRSYRPHELFKDASLIAKESDMWAMGMLHQDLIMAAPHWTKPRTDFEQMLNIKSVQQSEKLNKTAQFKNLRTTEFQFLEALVKLPSEDRMTVDEALNHPWLTEGSPPTPLDQLQKVQERKRDGGKRKRSHGM